MSNISVAEMLKIHAKWIESTPFASLVAERKKVTDRHAYNLIKKAHEDREILKIPLPNRKVLYGLPEFGPPFKEKLSHKQVNEYAELDPENAEIIAKIDFFSDYFIDQNAPENKEFILLLKMVRDYHMRVGKARGR